MRARLIRALGAHLSGKYGDMKMLRLEILLSLVLLLIFCVSSAKGQVSTTGNSLGLIVLSKGYSQKGFIHIYNKDGSLWHKFTFYYDDCDGNFEYANESFRPFAFHQDYFLLALKCLRKDSGRYEVIVNEETGLTKYVKANDPTLRFEKWEDHILKVFSVEFNRKENPVLEVPQGRVKKVAMPNAPFHPVEVRGEWLKVKWEIANGTRQKGAKYNSGWIRWKRGDRLLVELFYFA
jgi:hypothetical protein